MRETGLIKHFYLASLATRTLEKQIAEVFDPSPVSLDCALCKKSFCTDAECELICPDCRNDYEITCLEELLETEGIDLDSVGEFCETDGEDLSPLGEFYFGKTTYDGPEYRCTPKHNELLLELKKLKGGRL